MNRRAFFLLALPFPLKAAPFALSGRWRSVTTTRGGIGAVYQFYEGGRATYSSVAIVEMDYRQTGDQLTLGGEAMGMGWHPDGRLQFNHGQNQVEDFTREGKLLDPGNPLLGEWRGSRMMQGRPIPVTLQFHPGQRAMLVMYLNVRAGRFQATGPANSGWVLTLPPLPERRITQDPSQSQLVIQAANGDPHAFTRF